MAANPIPQPNDGQSILNFVMQNPGAIQQAMKTLQLLSNLQVSFATPGSIQGKSAFRITSSNALLIIPTKYPKGVPTQIPANADLVTAVAAINAILTGEAAIQAVSSS